MEPHLICCDLDGTLISRGCPLSDSTLETMGALRRRGHVIAIASGRSPYSAQRLLTPQTPIDYFIFSTGIGIIAWPSQELVWTRELNAAQVQRILEILHDEQMDYMVQAPVPDNHVFAYHSFDIPDNQGTDFQRRIDSYKSFARPCSPQDTFSEGASEIIAIIPPDLNRLNHLATRLSEFSVIRATSPMDDHSIWIEIFAAGVGKASAAQWLARKLEITQTCALGNDYNDEDLLQWSKRQLIAKDSPEDLKQRFPASTVGTENALAEAAQRWNLL